MFRRRRGPAGCCSQMKSSHHRTKAHRHRRSRCALRLARGASGRECSRGAIASLPRLAEGDSGDASRLTRLNYARGAFRRRWLHVVARRLVALIADKSCNMRVAEISSVPQVGVLILPRHPLAHDKRTQAAGWCRCLNAAARPRAHCRQRQRRSPRSIRRLSGVSGCP